jgi:uncharacterized repeat protein (TIGR01451 family)
MSIYNSNLSIVNGSPVTVSDTLPAGLEIASAASSNSCGGAVASGFGGALVAGTTSFRLENGVFAASSSCDVVVLVRTTAGGTGSFVNTIGIGALQTAGGAGSNPTAAVATVSYVAAPVMVKAFNPTSVVAGSASTLTFTLSNANRNTLLASGLTGVSFTDTLPAGLGIFAPGAASGTCVGASGNSFSANASVLTFTGLTIPPAGSCTVVVLVTGAALGDYVNTASGVVSAQTAVPTTSVATATLSILIGPTVAKSFSPSTQASSGTGTAVLSITLSNSNAVAVTMASPGLLDIFPTSPTGMTLAANTAANSCGGSVVNSANSALVVGDVGIRLNGGAIPAGGNCTITTTVYLPLAGTYLNSTPAITSTNAGSSPQGATASVSITQVAALSISKTDGTTTLGAGSTTSYTITVDNAGPADTSGALLRDQASAGLNCTSMSCSASGGAVCPANNVALLLGAGLPIPILPSGSQVVVLVTCGVTATGR